MFELHPQLQADTISIGFFDLSHVLLMNNASLPWLILVPRKPDISEWHSLTKADQLQLHAESMVLSEVLLQEFDGDKLNTGAIGNIVPQLHLHHIVRYTNDSVWPQVVWGNLPSNPYNEEQLNKSTIRLKQCLSKQTSLKFLSA